jgi:16S rRNA (adenine1518-N6/adenine1519-N6)-dimethyltransferase
VFRPKLGQHFLHDQRFQRRIVAALAIREDDLVCEVGAGRGAMTGLLADRARQVVALEIDAELVQKVRQQYADQPNIEVVQADILDTSLAGLCRRFQQDRCYVFGNLPYYITSPILHHLLDDAEWIKGMGFVVQREVAERLTALPGSRAYGYLSVLIQLAASPRLEFGIPPGAFSPAPKVDSALVTFEMSDRLPAKERTELLEFVKLCFAHKRKNLLNNLQTVYARRLVEGELAALRLPLTIRAEQLPFQQFAELHARLWKHSGSKVP